MTRTAALAFGLGLLATAAARADLAVPPPAGKKFVRVDYTITAKQSFPDYEFYLQLGFGTPKKVDFGPDTPVKIDGNRGGVASRATFAALPKGTAAKYADDKAFTDAFRKNKIAGMFTAKQDFNPRVLVDVKDERKEIAETLVVEAIDAKTGFVFTKTKGAGAPPPGKAVKDAPGEGTDEAAEPVAAYAPHGGAMVAGIAAALALALTGLWLARRRA